MSQQPDPYKQVRKGILPPGGIYRGLTYGHYLAEWLKMLHSDAPYYRGYPRETCFLSGNNSFVTDKDSGQRRQYEEFQNKARNKDGTFRGLIIYPDTAIFVPVRCSFYSVGEMYYYDGNILQTVADCQFVCRRDINEGLSHYCNLQKKGKGSIDLFDNVCYFETPSFSMTVTENSPMKDNVEMPIAPGTYDSFVAAFGIMLNASDNSDVFLPEGEYRIQYGNIGRGGYKSDSIVDFIVRPGLPVAKTILGSGPHGNQKAPQDKKVEKKITEIVEPMSTK